MSKNIWDKNSEFMEFKSLMRAIASIDHVLRNQNTLYIQQSTTKHLENINKLVFFQVKTLIINHSELSILHQ